MIRVLIVDDSALVRRLLTELLSSDSRIEVCGVASDPIAARRKIKQLNPDVLTLDVEMPKMDGVTFLGNLMRLRPMPVVMVSTLTEKGADITFQALELGAVDFIAKPKVDLQESIKGYRDEIIEKVVAASKAKVDAISPSLIKKTIETVATKNCANSVLEKSTPTSRSHFKTTDKLIAIGSSTGGTEAVKVVLAGMSADSPAVVISQHIPEAFSGPFAARVNSVSPLDVSEAKDGIQLLPGCAYIAPGNRHLLVKRDGARFICQLYDGEPVNRHIPSVDVMFRSVANNIGPNAISVLLTGMGADGVEGMNEMRAAGAPTVAQDEATSVVWGMPGEAVKRGYVDTILPIDKIAANLLNWYKKETR